MFKKILIAFLTLIASLATSLAIDSFLRRQIFNLYRWTTENNIIFIGKDFYIFPSTLFLISFTISFSTLILVILNYNKSVLKHIIYWLIIFIVTTILIVVVDANRLILECTNCENGIRKLKYSKVNYGFILYISSFLSIIPSIVVILKKRL